MNSFELRRALPPPLLVLAAALLAGCAATGGEPDDAYAQLPPQRYPFATVWECMIEATAAEGFAVHKSTRDAEGGTFLTRTLAETSVPGNARERARRVKVRVDTVGESEQRVQIMASVFERPDVHNAWSYEGPDEALLAALEDHYERAIRKRYEPGN